MLQDTLNLLYAAEECLEKAAESTRGSQDLRMQAIVSQLRANINHVLENEEENMTPEDHPNFSVVSLDAPEYWQGSQSHHFRRHYEHKGRKFRVMINRDAYDSQSGARIEGFDPQTLSWNFISSVPFSHWPAKAQSIVYVRGLSVEEQGALLNLANTLTEKVRMLMFTPNEVV